MNETGDRADGSMRHRAFADPRKSPNWNETQHVSPFTVSSFSTTHEGSNAPAQRRLMRPAEVMRSGPAIDGVQFTFNHIAAPVVRHGRELMRLEDGMMEGLDRARSCSQHQSGRDPIIVIKHAQRSAFYRPVELTSTSDMYR